MAGGDQQVEALAVQPDPTSRIERSVLTESRGALMGAYADGGRDSAPSPKPVMPPAVTWGQMANPGVPGGSGPVVKDNRNLQSASGGLQRHLPVSGGSSGSGSSGGGGSGSSGSG